MNRIDKACCGDCAQCQLLADGKVDMVPCILDQLFRKVQNIERMINDGKPSALALPAEKKPSGKNQKKEEYVQEDD